MTNLYLLLHDIEHGDGRREEKVMVNDRVFKKFTAAIDCALRMFRAFEERRDGKKTHATNIRIMEITTFDESDDVSGSACMDCVANVFKEDGEIVCYGRPTPDDDPEVIAGFDDSVDRNFVWFDTRIDQ